MMQAIEATDAAIEHEVRRELEWDVRIADIGVGIAVSGGLVTLSGTVGSHTERLAAQEAAHRVRGVLDVVNHIHVPPPVAGWPSDAEIVRAMRHELEHDPIIRHQDIASTVSDGWVTLDGRVGRWGQRDEVQHVVQHIAGVRGINNRIAIQLPPANPSDVRHAVAAALERLAGQTETHEGRGTMESRAIQDVDIMVEGGTVTLSGRVDSWAQKRAAVAAAGHTSEVCMVVDHLRLEPTEIEA